MLTAVDAVEITILVDNLSDSLLPSTPIALRPRMSMEADAGDLRAEHGYGVLVTVESGGRQSSFPARACRPCLRRRTSSGTVHRSAMMALASSTLTGRPSVSRIW